MKKIKNESITSDFKSKVGDAMGSKGVLNMQGGAQDYLDFVAQIPQEEEVIRKPKKKGISNDIIGNQKMNLPIGKLYSMGSKSGAKSESNEATGASAGGQYSQPLFSSNKKEVDEKWSEKYKRSIDCNNPKGFSQKAHCQGRKKKKVNEEELKGGKGDNKTIEDLVRKYKKLKDAEQKIRKQVKKGTEVEKEHTNNAKKAKEIAIDHVSEDPKYYDKLKKIEGKESLGKHLGKVAFKDSEFVRKSLKEKPKKTETKEATGASSSGQYSTTAAWAKSTKKKDWRGLSKTQIPGGKFVQVKKKCKKFPYCNQGDIKALNIFDHVEVKEIIKEVSNNYGVSEQVIKNIIAYEYNQYKSNK